jgi:PD-(D/E)XK endonuclease
MKKPYPVRLKPSATSRPNENRKERSNQSKRKGELAELAFLYKAAGLGLGVAKPYGDSERFDFIVSSGPRLWRVQVKSTYKPGKFGYGVHTYSSCYRGGEMYTPDEIDLIVVYLVPENIWYIVPIKAVGVCRALYFYPHGSKGGTCRYEKYREAWWLMKPNYKSCLAKKSALKT